MDRGATLSNRQRAELRYCAGIILGSCPSATRQASKFLSALKLPQVGMLHKYFQLMVDAAGSELQELEEWERKLLGKMAVTLDETEQDGWGPSPVVIYLPGRERVLLDALAYRPAVLPGDHPSVTVTEKDAIREMIGLNREAEGPTLESRTQTVMRLIREEAERQNIKISDTTVPPDWWE